MRPDHVCSNPFFVGATPSSRKTSQTAYHRPGGGAPTKGKAIPHVGATPSSRNPRRPPTIAEAAVLPQMHAFAPVGATPPSRKASQTTTNHPDHRAPSHLASLAAVPETKNSLQTSQGRVNKGFDLESQLGRHKDGPCHFLIKSDVLPGDWLAFVKTGSRKTVATVWPEASCPLGPSLLRHLPKKADSLIFVTSRSPVDKVGGQLR